MMLEIFVSFLILFTVWTLSVFNYQNYIHPSGIESDQVWAVDIEFNTGSDSIKKINRELIRQQLKTYPEVESFSFASANVPYSNNTSSTGLKLNDKEYQSNVMNAEASYPTVLGLQLSEGRWFNEADLVAKNSPIIINKTLKEAIFGNENAAGKVIKNYDGKDNMTIVGVVENFKHQNDFQAMDNCYWAPLFGWESTLLLKVKPNTTADFEAKLSKEILQLGKDWSLEVKQLPEMKQVKNREVLIPVLILFIISGFLILNVALGLFGVLFQTISRRKQEIGIRRAIGATQTHILWHFIGETAVIATFGILLGTFFAVQFPLLNVFNVATNVYLLGLGMAVLSIYVLVVICAFVPSQQASKIYPALALHAE